jgi:alkanesulfonate monooxygenase SsuD/methylene tetrahydromethanopterin reductase-like flavin-dependent oxidoreductase (luciferase family)
MRFDSSIFWNHLEVVPWSQQVGQARAWTQALEALGFTGAWSSEHHFMHGVLGSPANALLAGADVLSHTSKLRFGGAPWAIMDRHPLMVAEDAAMVDHMSGGRLEFGAGRGFPFLRWGSQFVQFADRRNQEQNRALFEEVLDIVVKAWTQDVFSYQGRFYTLPVPGWVEPNPDPQEHRPPYYNENFELVALPVVPKPFQKPHPPVWIMADSVTSYAFAGGRGYNVLGLARPPAELTERFEAYRGAAKQARGVDLDLGANIGIQFLTYCAPTTEQAERDTQHIPSGQTQVQNRASSLVVGEKAAGTPDYFVELIETYRQQCNLQMFQLRPSVGRIPFSKAMASLELFADKVMPRFAADGGWVGARPVASGVAAGQAS